MMDPNLLNNSASKSADGGNSTERSGCTLPEFSTSSNEETRETRETRSKRQKKLERKKRIEQERERKQLEEKKNELSGEGLEEKKKDIGKDVLKGTSPVTKLDTGGGKLLTATAEQKMVDTVEDGGARGKGLKDKASAQVELLEGMEIDPNDILKRKRQEEHDLVEKGKKRKERREDELGLDEGGDKDKDEDSDNDDGSSSYDGEKEMDENWDAFEDMKEITSEFSRVLNEVAGRIPKALMEFAWRAMRSYELVIGRQARKIGRLEGKLRAYDEVGPALSKILRTTEGIVGKVDERLENIEAKMGEVKEKVLVGAHQQHRLSMELKPKPSFALIVKGMDGKLPPEEVEKKMRRKGPGEGVRVREVRKLRTKDGWVVEVERREDVEKVSQRMREVGLDASTPPRMNPRVVVYDVQVDTPEERLLGKVRKLVAGSLEMSEEKFVKVVRKLKRGDETDSWEDWILELPLRARNKLLEIGRVYTGWDSMRIAKWERIPRCFKCASLDHVARNCEVGERCICCGEKGHRSQTCRKPPSCVNCKEQGRDGAGHTALSNQCPLYKRRLEVLRHRLEQSGIG